MRYLRTIFRDLSIKYKIALIVLVTSGSALVMAGASLVTFDVSSYKRALVNDLSVKADIIAANSTAALAFEDYDSARQTLSGLVHEYRILVAYLLSAEGLTFASYSRGDLKDQHRKPVLREEGFYFTDDFLAVRRAIYFDGEVMGHIYIEADLADVAQRVRNFVATVGAISAGVLAVIMFLTSGLQRIISTPILALAGLAKQISRDRDYSVRAVKTANDEVGSLIEGFNEMLGQIAERDERLERHRDEYYHLLYTVSTQGRWRAWIMFVLNGIIEQSRDAIELAVKLSDIEESWRQRLADERASALAQRLADSLFQMPVLTIPDAARLLDVSYHTARYNVQKLVDVGILQPLDTEPNRKSYISRDIYRVVTESGVGIQSD